MSNTKDMFKNDAPSFAKTMVGTVIFLNVFAIILGGITVMFENIFKSSKNKTNNQGNV